MNDEVLRDQFEIAHEGMVAKITLNKLPSGAWSGHLIVVDAPEGAIVPLGEALGPFSTIDAARVAAEHAGRLAVDRILGTARRIGDYYVRVSLHERVGAPGFDVYVEVHTQAGDVRDRQPVLVLNNVLESRAYAMGYAHQAVQDIAGVDSEGRLYV